jgi:hypothetical protein
VLSFTYSSARDALIASASLDSQFVSPAEIAANVDYVLGFALAGRDPATVILNDAQLGLLEDEIRRVSDLREALALTTFGVDAPATPTAKRRSLTTANTIHLRGRRA